MKDGSKVVSQSPVGGSPSTKKQQNQPQSSKTLTPEKIIHPDQQQQTPGPKSTSKTPAKSTLATPKRPLPFAEENDTVYGFKSSISERIFDKDPEIEKSEYEKSKLCGRK